MNRDYLSCEKCGCVVDVIVLKEIEENKSDEQREKESYDSSYLYKSYYDFEKIRCPCCKALNQR